MTGAEQPDRSIKKRATRSWIVPILLIGLGLSFALVPFARGRMFFYWDNAQQHFAQTVFLQAGLDQRTLPQWWPNVGLGFPATAEGQAAHYHPIRLLSALLLTAPAALMWELALYFVIAGISTYFFLRQFRLHSLACLLGAASHMFCGFAIIYVRNVALHRSFCLFPLAMLCAEHFLRRGRVQSLAAAAAVFGVQFLSGHPSFAIVTIVATSVYVALRSLQQAWRRQRQFPDVARTLGVRMGAWIAAGIFSMGLAAVQVVPTLLHAEQSQRQGGLSFDFATGSQPATVRGLGQLLFPYAYTQGDWLPEPAFWGRFNTVTTSGMYSGVMCVVLAPLALWWRRRWPDPSAALAAAFVISVAFALGAKSPLFPALWSLPGMNGFRFPSRFLLWAAFCLSCLAALGLHRLLALSRLHVRPVSRLLPLAVLTVGVLLIGIAIGVVLPDLRAGILLSLGWLAAGLAITATVVLTKGRFQIALALLAAGLAIADLGFFREYGRYAQAVPIDEALSPPSHAVFLKRDPEPFRVMALVGTEYGAFTLDELRDFVQADLSTVWGIDSADVFLSLFLRRYYAVSGSIKQEILRDPEAASLLRSFLGVMNVKYLVAPIGLTLTGWSHVHQSGATAVWENPNVLPRAFLVGEVSRQHFDLQEPWRLRSDQRLGAYYRTISDWQSRSVDAQILDHVMARQLDYGRTAEVEDPSAIDVQPLDQQSSVRTLATGPDEMRFAVSSSKPAYLVISNSFYPGWTATIDGRPARVQETNWIMMGLAIPAGRSEVILRFETPGFRAGLWTSISALMIVALVLAWPRPLSRLLSRGSSRPSASSSRRTRR